MAGLALVGCAGPAPLLAGGAAPSDGRVSATLGGAIRIPTRELRTATTPDGQLADVGRSGGAASVRQLRLGLPFGDVWVATTGSALAFGLRGQLTLDETSAYKPNLQGIVLVRGGIASLDTGVEGYDSGATLGRFGAELPLLFGLNVVSVFELWLGPRVGIERVFGELGGQSAHATVVSLGGVTGVALGFGRVHALMELSANWERWEGSHGPAELSVDGLVWTPAFGVRYTH